MTNTRRRVPGIFIAVAFLAGPGCSGEDPVDDFPLQRSLDGGGIERFVADSPVSPMSGSDAAPRTEAGGGTDARPSGDGASAVNVTVVIDKPTAGMVLVASERFTPSVTVVVENASATEPVSDVNAIVIKSATQARVSTTMLSATRVETVPESATLVYRFTDVPVDLARFESGQYELLVTVKVGEATLERKVMFLLDAGPLIRFETPGDGKAYRGSTPVSVSITDPLFGPVKDVRMFVGQRPLMFAVKDDQYTATVDFSAYETPLEGDQLLTVRAANRNNTEASAFRRFVADQRGPIITNTVPVKGALIGRVIAIEAEISDPAGVLDSSVLAVVGHGDKTFEVKLEPPAAGAMRPVYRKLFDTTRLPANALFPSISFRASDLLGNESAVAYLLSLDNTPPLADLDPPADFRVLAKFETGWRCSWPIDPVGPDAVDDGDKVSQLFDVRARVEDQGNEPLDGAVDFTPIALVDPDRAQLLVLDDTRLPLVVDTNDDGFCDDINPHLRPTTTPMTAQDALLINMAPLPPSGAGDHMIEDGVACSGGGPAVPDPVCETTYNASKTRWYQGIAHVNYATVNVHYATSKEPAIWTLPPVVPDGVQCAGRQFDAFANNIGDGWACLAVWASDKLGNQQVSRVLRVCIDSDGKNGECPHKSVIGTSMGGAVVVQTATAHGYADGTEVVVSGVYPQTAANGRFRIRVIDATSFELVGSTGFVPTWCLDQGAGFSCNTSRIVSLTPGTPVVIETEGPHGATTGNNAYLEGARPPSLSRGPWPIDVIDANRFSLRGSSLAASFSSGRVVSLAEMPDCTGTQTSKGPPPVVDPAKSCRPWRAFARGEQRRMQ